MKRVIKNYCKKISNEDLNKLQKIISKYNKCKNLFYTKYYNNINIIFLTNKNKLKTKINYLVANNLLPQNEYNLLRYVPETLYKAALINTLNDLKIAQQTTLNKCQRIINRNNKLTKEEKRYLIYIIKSPNLVDRIIKYKNINIKKNFKIKTNKKLHNLLRRLIRKYKPNKPVSKSKMLLLNLSLTKKKINYEKNKLTLYITSLQKRKPIKMELSVNNKHQYSGSVRLILKNNKKIELHKPINIKYKKINYKNDIVNIAFTTKHLIITDNNIYGNNISNEIYKIQKILNKNKKLNDDNFSNIKRIINEQINLFIENETPQKIRTCDLDRSFMINKLSFNKYIINYLQKYIRTTLLYKLNVHKIKLKLVNVAYIDKACSTCYSINTKCAAWSFKCLDCTSHISYFTNILTNIQNFDGISLMIPHSKVRGVLERKHINKI